MNFLFSIPSQARIYINIGAPETVKKSIIALSDFRLKSDSPTEKEQSLGQKMTQRLNKNLKLSSYFNVLSSKAFIEDPKYYNQFLIQKTQEASAGKTGGSQEQTLRVSFCYQRGVLEDIAIR